MDEGVCREEMLTFDYHYALESACGDLQFLVSLLLF